MSCNFPVVLALGAADFQRIPVPLLIASGVALAVVLLLWGICEVPLSYNIRNLTVRWKTTVMTALAFTLVLGLMTVMLAFVKGMQRLTENSGQPGNVIVLAEGATDEGFSNLDSNDVGDIENQPGVTSLDGIATLCRVASGGSAAFGTGNATVTLPGGTRYRKARFTAASGHPVKRRDG